MSKAENALIIHEALWDIWPERGPMAMHKDGLTLIFDERPALVLKDEDTIIGIDAMVRAFRAGYEVKVDPHRRFILPPVIHEGQFDPIGAYQSILFDSIAEAPAPGGWRTKGTVTTLYPEASGHDGFISSRDDTYSNARQGISSVITLFSVGGTEIWVGQDFDGFEYTCYEAFIQFPTDTLGSLETITDAVFSLWLTADNSATNFTVQIKQYDWGVDLTTGDYLSGTGLASASTRLTLATSGIGSTGAYKTFTNDASFVGSIDPTDEYHMVVCSSRHAAGSTPTGDEFVKFSTVDQSGTTQDPKLVLTHTSSVPPLTTATASAASNAITHTGGNQVSLETGLATALSNPVEYQDLYIDLATATATATVGEMGYSQAQPPNFEPPRMPPGQANIRPRLPAGG